MKTPRLDFDQYLDLEATRDLFDHMRDVVWVNLLSLPSLALPNGIQLVARRFHEAEAAAAAAAICDALEPVLTPSPPRHATRPPDEGKPMSEVLPKTGFQSPYDVPTPVGAEGWEEMYPYYLLFDPARREEEEKRFWFYNGMHFPEPMPAFDMITGGSCYQSIGLYQGRVFSIPTVLGIEHRVVNGYVYITSNEVTDPAEIEKRLEVFLPRIGFYYANWDSLVNRWQAEVDKRIEELATLEVPKLPELEDEQEVIHDHKLGSNYRLMRSYDRTLQALQRAQPAPFRAAPARLRRLPDVLPVLPGRVPRHGHADDDADDRRLRHDHVPARRRAEGARALGARKRVDGAFTDGRSHEEILAELSESEAGREWIADLESRQHPWFYMSTGDGFYHHHRAWADDPAAFAAIGGYIRQLGEGRASTGRRSSCSPSETGSPPSTRPPLSTDEERGAVRRDARALPPRLSPMRKGTSSSSSTGAPRSSSTRCARSARSFVDQGFLRGGRTTSSSSTSTRCMRPSSTSASPGPAALPGSGNPVLATARGRGGRRSSRSSQEWSPPPALGTVPEVISDPTVQSLWGITADRLHAWAATAGGGDGVRDVSGYAASPGVVEGVARVVREHRRDRHGPAGRDSRLLGHCSELGARLPEDRRRRLRHRRDDV